MPTLRNGRIRWLAVPIMLGIFSLLTAGYLITFTPCSKAIRTEVYDSTHQRTVEVHLREVNLQLQPEDVVVPYVVTPNRNACSSD